MLNEIYDEDNIAYNEDEGEIIDLYDQCLNPPSDDIIDDDLDDLSDEDDTETVSSNNLNELKKELNKSEYLRRSFKIKYPDYEDYIQIVPMKFIGDDGLIVKINNSLKKIHISKIIEFK